MCIQVNPAKLNNVKGINTAAIMAFNPRFTLAGSATEKKIINAGMVTEVSAPEETLA